MARNGGTRTRLLAAASELFAERGFHGTTVRDIAARAKVNVAAGHYHFGSKKALYLEVLRAQFAEVRALLHARGASVDEANLARCPPPELGRLLRARIKVMLELLIGPPPGLHGTLMQREMCDPSEALPVIVEEFIRPMLAETTAIVSGLEPGLGEAALERCALSVIGQALFYRVTMPAMLLMRGERTYPRALAASLADHIAAFSLAGMAGLGAPRKRRRHAH